MDPYEDGKRKFLSPLDKPQAEPPLPMEALVEIQAVKMEDQQVAEEPTIPVTSLLEHLSDLRKQIIKGLTVFILFFIVVFFYY
ncbi:hypothetical protein OL548_06170 [Lysinibacillus sp. MHQ-1]|nr:hypothetical protein OL548_06170 [Lysinibacillus sp. MHQ-1]